MILSNNYLIKLKLKSGDIDSLWRLNNRGQEKKKKLGGKLRYGATVIHLTLADPLSPAIVARHLFACNNVKHLTVLFVKMAPQERFGKAGFTGRGEVNEERLSRV